MKERHIGQRIKDLRLSRQMRQKDIAVWLGISIGTVVRLERGEACREMTKAKIESKLKSQEAAA